MSRRNAPESKQTDLFYAAKLPSADTSARNDVDRISQAVASPTLARQNSDASSFGNGSASRRGSRSSTSMPEPGNGSFGGASGPFLTVKQVAARYAVSPSTIWRWTHENPAFPKPVKLGSGATRWVLAELLVYEAGLGRST
ncbi:AlpA family phage regulatory protein [Hoeflea sp.]|uniref:helix-turn-helix transcriptional regulator n=1 Tax=Hoeflea sp. TaxID=1940281 RepID=UPI0032EE54EC